MTVEKKEVKPVKAPMTVADKKVNTVAEAAALIAQGNKIGHPGPWVEVKPRPGLNSVADELIELQKENKLVGYNPKTGKAILK